MTSTETDLGQDSLAREQGLPSCRRSNDANQSVARQQQSSMLTFIVGAGDKRALGCHQAPIDKQWRICRFTSVRQPVDSITCDWIR